jgi:hypothetical protein
MMIATDITVEVSDCEFLSNIISSLYHFEWILLEEHKKITSQFSDY